MITKQKLSLCFIIVFFASISLFADGTEPAGSGTVVSPYLVVSADNLLWISTNTISWGAYFKQTADIDAQYLVNWKPIGNWSDGNFVGSYDGDNHTIDGLYSASINGSCRGIFGVAAGIVIKNLGITNIDVRGKNEVGALVGTNLTTIINCYSSGSVKGEDYVGGLVGRNLSSITDCHSTANVNPYYINGGSYGGLVGKIETSSAIISNCYSTGSVNGNYSIGGLVGYSIDNSQINNCYSIGNVNCGNNSSGGLVGFINSSTITNSYSTGWISGGSSLGGLVGRNTSATVTNSFWDTQSSGQSSSAGGTGKTTAEMKNIDTFTDAGWDFTGESTNGTDDDWSIDGSNNSGYPWLTWEGYNPVNNTWDGSSSTDWNTAANWDLVAVPTVQNNPIISSGGNQPVIAATGTASCNNLTVNGGASLTIQSTVSGTGSLIVSGTATGDVIFKRYVDEAAKAATWHYVSSPVAGQLLNDTWMTNNNIAISGTSKQFFRWDELTNYWIIYGSTGSPTAFTDNTFVEARGYALTRTGADELSFTGTVRTTNVNYATTYTSGKGDGFNLVGNPFSSSIGVTNSATSSGKFLADNTALLDDNYEALYIWDEQTGYTGGQNDYKVISNSPISGYTSISQHYVSPGQAFMVKVVSGGGNLDFNTNMQAHNNAAFYKNDKEVWPSVELIVENDELFNSTAIGFNENMTTGLDPSYDVGKLRGNPDIALYTKLIEDNGVDFAIQALPYFEKDYSVKVGLDVANAGEYTFEAATMEQIPEEVYVYFEDKLTAKVTNLKETDNYTCVISEAGSITNRFVLHFTSTPFNTEEINIIQSKIHIWSANKIINIFNPENLKGQIRIINMYGQKLLETPLNGNDRQQITINVPTGNYVVNIVDQNFSLSKKVFIGN